MRSRYVLAPWATIALAAVLVVVGLSVAAVRDSSDVEAFGGLRIAAVGNNGGNQAADAIPLDVPGSTVVRIDEATFNAMSPAALRRSYDVLLITWDSDESLNVDWRTRLLPFIKAGGGVVYEDPENTDDLSAILTTGDYDSDGDIRVIRQVRGLTDGVVNEEFDNNHIGFASWASWLKPFLENDGGIVGLYGATQGGCIVLTGPDQDYHGERGGPGEEGNQYRLLLNAVKFVSGGCGATNTRRVMEDPLTDDRSSSPFNAGNR